MDDYSWIQKGWECPRCGKILAPWMAYCDCKKSNWSITWTSDKTNPYPTDPNITPVSPDLEKYKYTVTCKSDIPGTFTAKA